MFSFPENRNGVIVVICLLFGGLLTYFGWAGLFVLKYEDAQIAAVNQLSDAATEELTSPTPDCSGFLNVLRYECRSAPPLSKVQVSREMADLVAQQEMARWALIAALVSIPAVFLSSLSLWALYWTFREQRRMLQNQERAILEIEGGAFWPMKRHSIDHVHVEVAIKNVGRTPAQKIILSGKITMYPEHTFIDAEEVECRPEGEPIVENVTARSLLLPPGQLDVLFDLQATNIDFSIIDGKTFGTAGPNFMCPSANLTFSGHVDYTDVFGKEHTVPFFFRTYSMDGFGSPHHFEEGARSWRASAYVERAMEAEERMRQRVLNSTRPRSKGSPGTAPESSPSSPLE